MASQPYPTTQRLFRQVLRSLNGFGLGSVVSPLVLGLMAFYITCLLLLARRQNGTWIANRLPARAHDAINRLLRVHALSTRALMGAIIEWAKRLGEGYLVVDDVVVSKPFSKQSQWVGRIPVAFRLWRPKKHCRPGRYRTKPQLAWEMIVEVYQSGLPIQYIVFDTFYTAGWLTEKVNRLGLKRVGVLHPNTIVHYRNRRWSVASLGRWLKLKWRARLQHVAFVLIAFVILQRLRRHPKETGSTQICGVKSDAAVLHENL